MSGEISTTSKAGNFQGGVSWFHTSSAYRVGALVSIIVFLVYLVPATPLFIQLLLPFPELDDTVRWTGRVTVQPLHLQGSRIVRERMFIDTATGRHEFGCGYFGDRKGCPEHQVLNGATGEVWFSRTHGALQWRFIVAEGNRRGQEEMLDYATSRAHFRKEFRYGRYVGNLLVALLPLAVALWQIRRFSALRERRESIPGRSPS